MQIKKKLKNLRCTKYCTFQKFTLKIRYTMYCTFQNIHNFKNIIKIINLQYIEDSNLKIKYNLQYIENSNFQKKNPIFNILQIDKK